MKTSLFIWNNIDRRMNPEKIERYLERLRKNGTLQKEIDGTITLMQNVYKKNHHLQKTNPEEFSDCVKTYTFILHILLGEKARQENLKRMSENNSSSTENSSARPTDNPPSCIRMRNILKKKIARHT